MLIEKSLYPESSCGKFLAPDAMWPIREWKLWKVTKREDHV
jgi:hypothetical protein